MPNPSNATTRPEFPFYDGRPVPLSGRQWALVLLALGLGFAALSVPTPGMPWQFLQALLFALIPLLTLHAVAGPQAWGALFRRLSVRDGLLAVGIALLNLVVTVVVALLVSRWFGANANPVVAALAGQGGVERALFFVATLPQLLGEELLTILPLLALLQLFTQRLRWSRGRALAWAWLLSALPFALLHLPTYQWNLLQCVLVIGTARLVLSLAYLHTRNLLVSTLAHVLNDWAVFAVALAMSGQPA